MTGRKCVFGHTCPVPLLLLLERSHTVSGDEASVELMRPKTNGSHFEGFHAFISYNFDIIKSQDSHNIAIGDSNKCFSNNPFYQLYIVVFFKELQINQTPVVAKAR